MSKLYILETKTPVIEIHNSHDDFPTLPSDRWFVCPTDSTEHMAMVLKYGKDVRIEISADDMVEMNEIRMQWTEHPFPIGRA
ncbi:hypothetical protein [Caballeronia zhejiangensis]|uniref:hypothetical protein n=1 Tax=Caballeronia zhejiangensis TaxID=871203 RepID=UPI001F5213F1|nr:hypothetical protein [Caballeronia zhejiangensis]MCI1046944.1 hypothetical protein [Caballeronia zhejiangensis]